MHPRTLALCALVFAVAPFADSRAQQPEAARNCDAGVARRQLTGQPMTDFMTACRANRVNPENLGKICNGAADTQHLSGAARQSYVAECTKGPG